jgi:hypothetical protein
MNPQPDLTIETLSNGTERFGHTLLDFTKIRTLGLVRAEEWKLIRRNGDLWKSLFGEI